MKIPTHLKAIINEASLDLANKHGISKWDIKLHLNRFIETKLSFLSGTDSLEALVMQRLNPSTILHSIDEIERELMRHIVSLENNPLDTRAVNNKLEGGNKWDDMSEEERQSILNKLLPHSEDFTCFPKKKIKALSARQAEAIQKLYELALKGFIEMTQNDLMRKVGSPNSKLNNLFRSNKKAKKVLIKRGSTNRMIQLNVIFP
ncbi:MAG: hypothetical protein ACKVQC_07505 [Elusimicrobiota bacterium]